jgi:hypothetical protein
MLAFRARKSPRQRETETGGSRMAMQDDPLPAAKLRTMQILAAALLMGVMIFLFVVLYMVLVQNQGQPLGPPQDLPIVSLIAAVILVLNAPLVFVMPQILTQSSVKQIAAGTWKAPQGVSGASFNTDADKLLAVKQRTLLISLALIEGAAFCALIGFLLEGQYLALGVVGLAVVLMLALFPTEGRVRSWLDQQLQRVADLRAERSGTAS